MKKIIRITTVPMSLNTFCKGLLAELANDYEVVAVSSPGPDLHEIASREGVRTVAVPMRRDIALLDDIVSLFRLVRTFRKERPWMVHSMTPKAGLLSMVAAWLVRVPVRVHTFTGLVFPTTHGLKGLLLRTTDRITCLCATHIIPEGEGVKNDLLQFNITHKPLKVLGHGNVRGIDLKYYSRSADVLEESSTIRKALNIPDGAFTFVFVGRLVGDKGMKELAEAFSNLSSTYGDKVHLVLVGDKESLDPLDEKTQSTFETLGNIHAVGSQKDVRPWYSAADALVFPSYREGFPNVVIEACAMGLPCIVTDINGAREIIINGENGVIIPSHDEKQLLGAMREFVLSPQKVKEMASRARVSVASRFEQGYVWRCLKEFYRSVS